MKLKQVCSALLVVFAMLVSTVATGQAPPAFRIGPDDVLTIAVWDQKDLDQVVFVRPDGKITLPLVGEVQAGGRTVAELTTVLTEGYAKSVKGAQVTVGVKEIKSRPIYFVGGFGKPGPVQLTQDLTLLQAISIAGGLAPTADPEGAFVFRAGKVIPIDLARLVQKRDAAQNLRLEPGDTIVAPTADAVYVQGEVKAPGAVKFTHELTAVRAIVQAGGFTNLAAPGRVTLLRDNAGKRENQRINVDDIIKQPESVKDVALKPNDILIVPQRLF